MANEFEWEDAGTTQDFFSEIDNNEPTGDNTSVEEVIKEVTKEEDEVVEEQSKVEVDLFEEEDEEIDSSFSEEEDEEVVVNSNISILNSLKERGLVDFELEEGAELTEEMAEELLEDGYEEVIESRIKERLTELPDDAKNIIQFVLKGGSLNEFLNQTMSSTSAKLTQDMDLDDESNQELIVREILAEEDEDEEFIETQIELLKDGDKLKMFAEKKFEKWLKENKLKQTQIVKEQEQRRAELIKNSREAKRKLTTLLSSSEDIGGVEPSKEDRKVLPSFMNDRTIKLQNGAEISEMQKELFYELPKNETAMVQLAILLRSRNEDGTFNFDSIANKVKTKVAKDIKQNVRRGKTAIPKSASKQYKAHKSLADYFS